MRIVFLPLTLALLAPTALLAQKPVEPTTPPPQRFHDPRSGISFQIPTAWQLTRKDHEVSTFALDAPSSIKSTQLRAIANITFNPLPTSTFSGAYFYVSFTPRTSAADCARQASSKLRPATTTQIGSVSFTHGYDEHGGVCIESRDDIYTAPRNGACYRFDLVINNFCGGDVSGVRDMNDKELESVRKRLESILATVQFDKN